MLTYNKDDFDGTLDDILVSVNKILNKTGEGYETVEENEKEKNENKKINNEIKINNNKK